MATYKFSDPFLGNFKRFGLTERETEKIVSEPYFAKWHVYREKELECFREFHQNPERLLLELAILEREHPETNRSVTANRRLDMFALEYFGQSSCDPIS